MMEFLASDAMIIILSAIIAMGSFVAFTLPLLNREEKRDRYRTIIEKKRKELFEQSKKNMGAKKSEQTLSAGESMAAVFKVQQMLGKMGEKARDKMLQAGIRNPKAPFKFIAARVALPVFLILWALLLIYGRGDAEPPKSSTVGFIILAAGVVGYALPGIILKNMIIKRSEAIGLAFPDALDMMLICVQGGIGLEQTVDRIAEEVAEHSPTLAEELGILSAEMAMLNDRRAALQDFARRVGSSSARSFATALIQAEQYGTSVSTAMRVMSDEMRDERMAKAEQKAASLPPKLTVPMILFFLPVLFVVIMGPVVIKFVNS